MDSSAPVRAGKDGKYPVPMPGITDRHLVFRAARTTQRCAGEGELLFGLTKHVGVVPKGGLACQQAIFAYFGPGGGRL